MKRPRYFFAKHGRWQQCKLCVQVPFVVNMDAGMNGSRLPYKLMHLQTQHPQEYAQMKAENAAEKVNAGQAAQVRQITTSTIFLCHETLYPSFLDREFYPATAPVLPKVEAMEENATQPSTVRGAARPTVSQGDIRPNSPSTVLKIFFPSVNLYVPIFNIILDIVDAGLPHGALFEMQVEKCHIFVTSKKPRDLLKWFKTVHMSFLNMNVNDIVFISDCFNHLLNYSTPKRDREPDWPIDLEETYKKMLLSYGISEEDATFLAANNVSSLQAMDQKDLANRNGLRYLHLALLQLPSIFHDFKLVNNSVYELAIRLQTIYPTGIHFSWPVSQL